MLPLTRSLLVLALAALLAAADASNCDTETFGETTDKTVTLDEVAIPGRITIPDGCPSQYGANSAAVGETITACNNDPDGEAPTITQVSPPDLSPVEVKCPDGCPSGGVAKIKQYCS